MFVVKEDLCVGERVREVDALALLVGVGDVDARDEDVGGEPFGEVRQPAHAEAGVLGKTPRVRHLQQLQHRERFDLGVVVGQDAEGRDDLLAEVLVLVVAPEHDHVRAELVECLTAAGQIREQPLPVRGGGTDALIVPPFPLGEFGPVVDLLPLGGDVGVLERALEQIRHVCVGTRQHRVVGDAEAKNLCHGRSSRIRSGDLWRLPCTGRATRPSAPGLPAGGPCADGPFYCPEPPVGYGDRRSARWRHV
ncbi:hypothetical protein PV726_40765 [Streptomyces europaeiscabiei]|uniref:hypothetical protein n=1 Tax=Streptomyces europaeiscabiei TaxID=146819 RepID=UPI0029B6916B|nr:hypothetical protein [Streptomyces europaeiscabiei]MDX3696512.1 hypothetical protein [Streptomyces europaeiscabiei]